MSDYSLEEKLTWLLEFFPELSEEQDEVQKFLLRTGPIYANVIKGKLVPVPLNEFLSFHKRISVDENSNIFANNAPAILLFTDNIRHVDIGVQYLLTFFGIELDQRQYSSFVRAEQRECAIVLSRENKAVLTFSKPFAWVSLDGKSASQVVREIISKTRNPKILSIIANYQRLNELVEIREHLENLEAEHNLPAIVLHNILDEGQLKIDRERRWQI